VDATREALLAAVVEAPDDDAPRLVLADWFEDNGEPDRAEALRLDVRRRKLDDLAPEAWALDARLEQLHRRHRPAWKRGLPRRRRAFCALGKSGLAEEAYVDSAEVLRRLEGLFFSAGPIRFLDLSAEGDNTLTLLAGCPYLPRVRALRVSSLSAAEWAGLSKCPGLTGLRELSLSWCYARDEVLEALATWRARPRLEALRFDHNSFNERGLRALAGAPLLSTVRELDLSRGYFDNAELRELLRSPHIRRLRKLNLNEAGLTSKAAELLASVDWQGLEVLDLGCNELGPVAARHLAGAPQLASLRSLSLSASDLGERGARALARSPYLGQLRVLDINFYKKPRHKGIEALAAAPWLPNLARLELCGTPMGTREIQALAAAPLTGLRWLDLDGTRMRDAQVRALLRAPWLSGLTHLGLDRNSIGAGGARALAEAPALEGLVHLGLLDNPIPANEARRLRQWFGDRVDIKRPRWDD
jgi:uncharacterized protein (TIGR02996 family)